MFEYGKTLTGDFPFARQEGARRALYTLSIINLINYADRYVASAVKSLIQNDLHLTDFETALPNTGILF